MLLLGSTSITIEGITVFPDHADPNQFWYLPGPVQLAKRSENQEAAFTFINYKPATVAAGVKGGGFLMFDTSLRLDPTTEGRILSRLSSVSKGQPKLGMVQFDEGTVKCIAMNLQGEGGTSASAAPAGAFNAVEKILGASVPSLQGDNVASFSLTLSQEGAIIIEQAYLQGTAPVGVIYDLKFTGIRPALDVKITADFSRIYQTFSASLEAKYYFFKAGIEAAFEKLLQDGAIKIEVTNFTGTEDMKQKEEWAISFFKEKLLTDWFEPTLVPGQVSGSTAGQPSGVTTPATGDRPSISGTTPSAGGSPSSGGGTAPASGGTTKPASGGGTGGTNNATVPSGAHTAPASATRPPAALTIVSKQPDPLPKGYSVTHSPSATGTSETINVSGGTNPTVRVDSTARQLDSAGQLTIDVQPNSSHDISVEYPAVAAIEETFDLIFFYEYPVETWVAGNPRNNANYLSYLNNNPNPADPQFSGSHAPSRTAPPGGADALRDWIQNSLVSPKEVELKATASFEGDASAAKQAYNQRLSQRRLDVARGIIGSTATIATAGAYGQTEAQQAARLSQPSDRVTKIKGKTNAGSQGVRIHAKLSRDAIPVPPPPTPTPPASGAIAGSPEVALKLKFLRQEEQKTLTFEYHRAEAVRRSYAPQGFFGLLLSDLQDKDKRFVEVDLDDLFFRVFTVIVDAPIDFQHIGLISAQVSIDYGIASDEANHKHGDFIFDAQNNGEKTFEVFMNANRDTSYTYSVQYHFDPNSEWEGRALSYELPPKLTEKRVLIINPYEQIGFLEVRVFPHEIDGGVIDSTDVHLSYRQPEGTVQGKILTVTSTSAPQFWRLRLDDPKARAYTYYFVHHLKDGTIRKTVPVVTQAIALPVNDLFEQPIDIDFIPLFDTAAVRMVFIDVEYDDADNNYHRQERLTLQGKATDAIRLRISVMNPSKRTFRYRMTFVGTNNQMHRGSFIETAETLIGVMN